MTQYDSFALAIDAKSRLAYVYYNDVVTNVPPSLDVYNVDTLALVRTVKLNFDGSGYFLTDLKIDSMTGKLYGIVSDRAFACSKSAPPISFFSRPS